MANSLLLHQPDPQSFTLEGYPQEKAMVLDPLMVRGKRLVFPRDLLFIPLTQHPRLVMGSYFWSPSLLSWSLWSGPRLLPQSWEAIKVPWGHCWSICDLSSRQVPGAYVIFHFLREDGSHFFRRNVQTICLLVCLYFYFSLCTLLIFRGASGVDLDLMSWFSQLIIYPAL